MGMGSLKEALKSARRSAAVWRRRPGPAASSALRTAGSCVLELALGFLLAGSRIAGNALPLAPCLVAAAGTPLHALSAMLGGVLGSLFFWGFSGGLEPLALCILLFAAVSILGGTDAALGAWFLPVLTAAMSLLVGLLFLIEADFAPRAVAVYLIRPAALAASVHAFLPVRRRRSPVSVLFFLA